tara:strand:+ start:288232 stop:289338 length:1107 start_codon:yes stop_codon:yes gene_type:complete
MLSKNELRYTLALQRVSNLGDRTAKKLLHLLGSAEAVFKEKKRNLLKIDGIGASKLKGLNSAALLDEANDEIEFIETNKISFSYFKDKSYPEALKHCHDGPILFFNTGNIDIQNKKIISIVGTRNITSYGKSFCEELISDLAMVNPVIVSGFAYGVDITAHRAAIENNLQTIGCLAHGLDQIYPRSHKKYMEKICQNGGFITEFWSTDAFDRNNFLKRNRIIAGISEATVVIESAEKGGSLVTADIAHSYNREVFAVPGKATDLQSTGCNNLIKYHQARLITSAADIIYMLGWKIKENVTRVKQTKLFVELTQEESILYEYLKKKDKVLLDNIALDCNFPTFKVSSLLLSMELKGVVRPLPGKLFQSV